MRKEDVNNLTFAIIAGTILGLIGLALITSANNQPASSYSTTTITTTTSSSTTSISTTIVRYPLVYPYNDKITITNTSSFKVLDGHTFKILTENIIMNYTTRFDYGNVIKQSVGLLLFNVEIINGNYMQIMRNIPQTSCKIISIFDINLTSGEAKLITNQTIIDAVSYGEGCG